MAARKIYDGRALWDIPELVERFANKHTTGDGCWEWTASLTTQGYGQFGVQGKMQTASRISWILANKRIPNIDEFVCHTCDNKKCVNPSHLYLGDRKTNGKDASDRGITPRGSRNGTALLTEDQVLIMRKLYHEGVCNTVDLAILTQSSAQHVWDVVVGRKWTHVGGQTGRKKRTRSRFGVGFRDLERVDEQVA